ncbi:hypothetical protein [Pseudofrankia asymbiotica]|uniref:hypothetical protein n=1 Tax=Pseudofrankia asymbiotica TaxID=1834516 RepID=UPI001F524C50|nr:hypothetical protein [Pseudofrankia asymbiotica]
MTLVPGSSPAELAAQIARLPTGLEFVEAFGDLRLVLVYGAPGVSSREAVRAVTASLATENGDDSCEGFAPDTALGTDRWELPVVS